MNRPPKISIITPIYNTELYLDRCIQSVIAQTFTDWELLLVDDGSTDSSGKICDRYAASDNRIRVFHRPNSGVADTRNFAISQAKGDLLGFVDADDWIEPDMYSTLFSDLTTHHADVAIGGYTFEWTDKSKPRQPDTSIFRLLDHAQAMDAVYEDRLIQSIFCDKLWRKETATALLPKGYFYEDYATVIKWMANANKVTLRTRPLYHYRMRRGSTVNGVHPVRRIHFVLAEIERAKFLQSIGYTPQGGFSGKILRSAVTMAKLIARGVDSKDEALHHISQICEIIKPYLPANENSLGHKTYSRLQKMLHSPRQFVRNVRFSRLFMFSSKRKEKHLYP